MAAGLVTTVIIMKKTISKKEIKFLDTRIKPTTQYHYNLSGSWAL